MPKIYVEDGDLSIMRMFVESGYELCHNHQKADLVVFSGGADVNPALYGETKRSETWYDNARDESCLTIYDDCVALGIPMVGICRGSQFLHVANGEKLWQHVDGHATGKRHTATEVASGGRYEVTSTHHQMMRYPFSEGSTAALVAIADESTYHMADTYRDQGPLVDVESVWHPDTRSLCFQPHPEYVSQDDPFQQWFFSLVEKYIWSK